MGFRRKRPVTITADLVRCAALASVPVAFAPGAWGRAVAGGVDGGGVDGGGRGRLGPLTCIGVYNPALATSRLELTPTDRLARMPAAWSVSIKAAIAALTALWGVLAALTSARTAIAPAGVLPLVTPLPLATVRRDGASVTDGATETAEVP